jgi:putative oxidoreductase
MKLLSNYPAEILILLFLVITFLISFVEKISDWKGTVTFIKEHFKNSPLKKSVPFLVSILVFLEFIATIFMIVGVYQIYTSEIKEFALLGLELSAVVLIFMLIGQRLAKDYPGAMSLTVYFILTVFGVFLLNS